MKDLKALKERIKGVCVPMLTPFKKNQDIDEDGLRKLTRYLIDSGVKEDNGFLLPTGSSGECPMLTDEERKRIWEIIKDESKNEVLIMGGCNHTDPRNVIKLVNIAEEVGLDSVMISPPYYWKPTDENIITHFKTIAKETNMGIMVYNNWFASQYDLSVDLMKRLVGEIPTIIAYKDNTPIISKFAKAVESLGDLIAVLNGSGPPNEPWTSFMGARGFVTSEACIIGKTVADVYKANSVKDFEKSKQLLKKAASILDFIFGGVPYGADYIRRTKALMNFVGLPGGIPRLPLLPLDNEFKTEIKNIVNNCKLEEVWNK